MLFPAIVLLSSFFLIASFFLLKSSRNAIAFTLEDDITTFFSIIKAL